MTMKKYLPVLLLVLMAGFSACNKIDGGPSNSQAQLYPQQAVLQFTTSNGWTADNYFENAPGSSFAQYGPLYNSNNIPGIRIEGYVPVQSGQTLIASINLEDWTNNPIRAGQTIPIQPVGNATQALITLETQQNGQYYDTWYSDYGEVYIQNYNGSIIEGSFSARMYLNADPRQTMDIRNGRFYARLQQ